MQEKIKKWVGETLGAGEVLGSADFIVEMPSEMTFGDYSTNIAMVCGKTLKENPLDLAEEFAKKLEENKIAEVGKVVAVRPGFINFFLKPEVFAEKVREIIEKGQNFGKFPQNGHTWVIEHTSPNPNKAMHIGHLRNNLTGMALARIAEANGYAVICDAIDNDRGIAIAKLMWGYLKFGRADGEQKTDPEYWQSHQDEWISPEEKGLRPDRFVDDLYVKGSADFDADPEVEKTVRSLVVEWENENKIVWELWRKVLSYSYAGQNETLKRLGNRWDFVWHEHEHYKAGKDYVALGLSKNIFRKTDDGAIITDLSEFGLSDTVVQKSDGTSLYITQDIALTKLKLEKYKAQKLFWVIGPEQSLAMQQMFAVCEELGIGRRADFTHIPYGYMSIKGQGKMSSRKGNVVFIDDVIDDAKSEIKKIMSEKDAQISDVESVSEILALGAVKFAVLKVARMQDVAFDVSESTSLQGDSGPYLQYATVRANSILKKVIKLSSYQVESKMPENWQTTNLERMFEKFESVILRSGRELSPHYIVTYLLQLSAEFNSFYAEHKIIDEADLSSPYKLALTQSFANIMTIGLGLLGISVPEEM